MRRCLSFVFYQCLYVGMAVTFYRHSQKVGNSNDQQFFAAEGVLSLIWICPNGTRVWVEIQAHQGDGPRMRECPESHVPELGASSNTVFCGVGSRNTTLSSFPSFQLHPTRHPHSNTFGDLNPALGNGLVHT